MAKTKQVQADTGIVDIIIGLFKMLKDSWRVFRVNSGTFLFLIFVPWLLVFMGIILSLGSSYAKNATNIHVNWPWLIASLVALILVMIFFLPATTYVQLASSKGENVGVVDSLIKSWPFVLRYLGLSIVYGFAVVLGLVLLIIPGVLIAFFLYFSTYVLLDKNKGIKESFRLCYKMVRANWKFVLAFVIVEAILNMLMSIAGKIAIVGVVVYAVLYFGYYCLPVLVYKKISK